MTTPGSHTVGEIIERAAQLRAIADEKDDADTHGRRPVPDVVALSSRDIARRSRNNVDGVALSHVTVNAYRNDRFVEVRSDSLVSIAEVCGTPEWPAGEILADLQRAAGVPVSAGLNWRPPRGVKSLTRSQLDAVEAVINSIAYANNFAANERLRAARQSNGNDGAEVSPPDEPEP